MPKYSAKARKRRQGSHTDRRFLRLYTKVKESTAYHDLSIVARALFIEIIARYSGANNGLITLSVREASYELNVGQATVSRAMREVMTQAWLDQPR